MPELYMKNNKVLTFKEEGGAAVSILKVDTPELLPLCLSKECSVEKYNEWMLKRSIPKEREEFDELKKHLDPILGDKWLMLECK